MVALQPGVGRTKELAQVGAIKGRNRPIGRILSQQTALCVGPCTGRGASGFIRFEFGAPSSSVSPMGIDNCRPFTRPLHAATDRIRH